MAALPAVLQTIFFLKRRKEGKETGLAFAGSVVATEIALDWSLWFQPLFDVKYWRIDLTDADCLPASNGI